MFTINPVDASGGVLTGQSLTAVQQVAHSAAEAVMSMIQLPGLSPTSAQLVTDVIAQLGHVKQRGEQSAGNTMGADITSMQALQGFITRDELNSLGFNLI